MNTKINATAAVSALALTLSLAWSFVHSTESGRWMGSQASMASVSTNVLARSVKLDRHIKLTSTHTALRMF